jgi:pimeloyl-ACP methyl ester carboxylesterase
VLNSIKWTSSFTCRLTMTGSSIKTLFLPGASGNASFWKPVAERTRLKGIFFAWPGLGAEPEHPDINGVDDLTALVRNEITEPVNIVAQSMGGVIAIKLALSMPKLVKRLVLAVTSGGVPVTDFGAMDWRPDYFTRFPRAAPWIANPTEDLSEQIPTIMAPTLLLWGGADPISPTGIGRLLLTLLPNARLCIIPGADHNLAQTHADSVAIEMQRHLLAT